MSGNIHSGNVEHDEQRETKGQDAYLGQITRWARSGERSGGVIARDRVYITLTIDSRSATPGPRSSKPDVACATLRQIWK
jgi:hypothetical protein